MKDILCFKLLLQVALKTGLISAHQNIPFKAFPNLMRLHQSNGVQIPHRLISETGAKEITMHLSNSVHNIMVKQVKENPGPMSLILV